MAIKVGGAEPGHSTGPPWPWRPALLLVALASLAGCSAEDPQRPAGTEAPAIGPAADPALPELRPTPEPLLVLGDAVDANMVFRVSAAIRLASGRIAVASGGTSRVLIFEPDGRLLAATGGAGEGPGEFHSLGGLARFPGDSILVLDPALRRLTLLNSDGRLGRVVPLPAEGSRFEMVGLLDDASIVLATSRTHVPGPNPERRPTLLIRYSSEGRPLDTIGAFTGLEIYSVMIGDVRALRALPFGRDLSTAAGGDRVYVGTGEDPAVQVRDRHGDAIGRITWSGAPEPVTAVDRLRHRERTLETIRNPEVRRLRTREFERGLARFPTYFPTHGRLLAGADGGLWVEEYVRPGDVTRRWHVLDPGGAPIGRVTLDTGSLLLDAGVDYLLVRAEDESGVESIRLYGLDRAN